MAVALRMKERKEIEREWWVKTNKKQAFWNRLLFWIIYDFLFSPVFKLKFVMHNKRIVMFILLPYANALLSDKHQSAFPLRLPRIDVLFFQLDYNVIRNAFSATRKFRRTAAPSSLPHNLLFYFIRELLRTQWSSFSEIVCIPFLNMSELAWK